MRLKDTDSDGIGTQLCFPSSRGCAGKIFLKSTDMEVALLCLQARSDFSIEEVKGAAPERFIA